MGKLLQWAREAAGDRFLIGNGSHSTSAMHFVRGLENVWMDIYLEPERLGCLIDVLVDMNLYATERYAECRGRRLYVLWDDWGCSTGR